MGTFENIINTVKSKLGQVQAEVPQFSQDFTNYIKGIENKVTSSPAFQYVAKEPMVPILGKYSPTMSQGGQALSETLKDIFTQGRTHIQQMMSNERGPLGLPVGYYKGSAGLAMDALNVLPPVFAANYVSKLTENTSKPYFPKDSLAPVGLGLVAGLVTPGGVESDIAKASKLKKANALEKITSKLEWSDPTEIQTLKNALAEGEGYLSTNKDPLGRILTSDKRAIIERSVENTKGKIQKYLTDLRGNQTSVTGLLTESPAQTAARRQAGLNPSDVYTAPIESIKTGVVNAVDNVKNEVTDFVRKNKIVPDSQKVGLLDYLRTPDRIMQKIGLGNEAESLKKAWAGYQKELPAEVGRISEWAKQVTPEGNARVFRYLDGQIKETGLQSNGEIKVAHEVKAYLKAWADRLGLPEDKRISSYITHIWEKDSKGGDFPDEIASLIRDKVPGSIYDPFVQKRLGDKGYIEDTFRALDAYVKRATRKSNLDPVLEKISESSKNLEDSQFKYIKNYIDRVNFRPTDIDIAIDNTIKNVVGNKFGPRPVTDITKKARQMVFRGLIGLNPATALRNLSQGANTYAELGEKYTALGYIKTVQNLPALLSGKETELEKVGVLSDGFINDRTLSATKQALQKFDEGLYYLFNTAEKINRGAAYFGAKAKYLKQGLSESEAIQKAIDVVRKTQFTFGQVDTPVALQSDIAKTLFQFQSYGVKQVEFLGEKVASKDWAGLVRYIASTLAFGLTIGKAFGWDVSQIIPSFQFSPPTLQLPYGIASSIPGDQNNPDKNLFQRITSNPDVQKGIMSYIPAGGQIRKTLQGARLVNQGYNPSASDRVQFAAPDTALGKAQALIFGPYATANARTYFDKNQSPLGDTQSQQVRDLIQAGKSPQDIIQGFRDQQDLNKSKNDIKKQLESGNKVSPAGLAHYFGIDEVSAMPENNLFQKTQKQQKAFDTVNKIIEDKNTTKEEKTTILNSLGISYQDSQYYYMASQNPDSREAFIIDSLRNIPQEKRTAYLAVLRRELNGKSVLTSTIINDLQDANIITKTQANFLKSVTLDQSGKPTIKSSGTGTKKIPPVFKAPVISTNSNFNYRVPKISPIRIAPTATNFPNLNVAMPQVNIPNYERKQTLQESLDYLRNLRIPNAR